MPGDREEMRRKHQSLLKYIDSRHLNAVVLTKRANFAWYTGGRLNHVVTGTESGVASLLITREGAICMTNTIESPRIADEELGSLGIEVRSHPWYDARKTSEAWSNAVGGQRVACDLRIPGLPDSVEMLDADFDRLRWVMTEPEIARFRSLCREVAECLEESSREARPGMTEHALAAVVARRTLERGIRVPVILIAADDRVRRFRHPIPTERKFEKYGMAVCCGERDGLIVSTTRLFSFGSISDDLQRRHAAVCRVDAAMIAATRPGSTVGNVFAVGQKAYAEAGFPEEWTYHHQGGSAGYQGREVKGAPGNAAPVMANQFFAWNPSIAGTKSEDTILVGPDRNEILTATGQWPTTRYLTGEESWPRCDILQM